MTYRAESTTPAWKAGSRSGRRQKRQSGDSRSQERPSCCRCPTSGAPALSKSWGVNAASSC